MAAGRTVGTVLPVACWLGVAACGLDFDRYAPGAGAAGGPDASTDGFVAEAATRDAVTEDVATGDTATSDSAQESAATPCPTTSGVLAMPTAPGPITIDGDLGDWGSPAFTLLDANDAALIMGPNGTCTAANATSKCLVPSGETAEVALLRDSANLYVGVRVTVPSVGGTSTANPYTNDAVELYLRGDPVATGDYTSVDQQYVIDWQNLVIAYGPPSVGTGQTNPPGVTSAVKVAPSNKGYVVEVKIALGEVGQISLAPGHTLGFDLGVDHGQGTAATRSFLVWWMATHAPPQCMTAKCMNCTPEQPYCDTLDFGLVCAE
jgi:hypothetical protein